jgi:hypothetical protein
MGPSRGRSIPGDDLAVARLPLLKVLVLQAGEVPGVAPAAGRPSEPPPHGDALRVPRRGLVEGARDGRPPVDDEGWLGRVLGDPQPPDVQLPVPALQGPEEQRPLGQFPQRLRPAAQLVPENFGIGAGGGHVLADDDLFTGALDHRGEGGPAALVVGAFLVEGVLKGRLGRGHSTERTRKRDRVK